MSKKSKPESWKDVVDSFKPAFRLEDYQVIDAECKKREIDITKYKSKFARKNSISIDDRDFIHMKVDLQPYAPFNALTDKLEFDVEPEAFGYAKKCELLIVTEESGLVNMKTRRTENGYFVFKCTIKADSPHQWLFFLNGRVYVMDMRYKDMFTDCIDVLDTIKEYSDFKKQYPKRVLIPTYEVEQLMKHGLVKSIISESEGTHAILKN